jgi:hypothetical protein
MPEMDVEERKKGEEYFRRPVPVFSHNLVIQ